MLALVEAGKTGNMAGEVVLVYGANPDAPALGAARDAGVDVVSFPDRTEEFGARLLSVLRAHSVDMVCLAGYLRLLPTSVLSAYPGRVLNIHPALLPRHGGKGMYGHHVHEAVLAAGDAESGCSVHLVTEVYDEGAVILQKRCPVLPGDTPVELAARVLELEHEAYPEAVSLVAAQRADEE